MDVGLTIASDEFSDEDLLVLSRDLCMTMNLETDIHAHLIEEPGEAGSRGELVSVGSTVWSKGVGWV